MSKHAPLDPISLEISWNGLKSIADECFLTIMRSAFSTNIKERHDHSTAIADAQGRLIVQAEMTLPIHLASMSGLMTFILDQYGDTIEPGDIFIGNTGIVEADVEAKNIVIQGEVNGNVKAHQQLEIHPTGKLIGDCTAASIDIKEGAVFEGRSNMIKSSGAAAAPGLNSISSRGPQNQKQQQPE